MRRTSCPHGRSSAGAAETLPQPAIDPTTTAPATSAARLMRDLDITVTSLRKTAILALRPGGGERGDRLLGRDDPAEHLALVEDLEESLPRRLLDDPRRVPRRPLLHHLHGHRLRRLARDFALHLAHARLGLPPHLLDAPLRLLDQRLRALHLLRREPHLEHELAAALAGPDQRRQRVDVPHLLLREDLVRLR